MAGKSSQLASFGLGVLALLCWLVMFLAGTDVWHDLGSPDFWSLSGLPYADLRAFAHAYYLLFIVLLAHLVVTISDLVRARRKAGQAA